MGPIPLPHYCYHFFTIQLGMSWVDGLETEIMRKMGHWVVTPKRGKNRIFHDMESMVIFLCSRQACLVSWVKAPRIGNGAVK